MSYKTREHCINAASQYWNISMNVSRNSSYIFNGEQIWGRQLLALEYKTYAYAFHMEFLIWNQQLSEK